MDNELKNAMAKAMIETDRRLKALREKLNGYEVAYLKGNFNWGHVGDLNHIIDELKNLTGERG